MAIEGMHRTIKVVFVGRVPWAGGAERVVIDIARHLDPTRFRPVIIHLYDGPLPPPDIARGLKFVKLAPDALSTFAQALLNGRLGRIAPGEGRLALGGTLLSLYRRLPSWLHGPLSPFLRSFREYVLESAAPPDASRGNNAPVAACDAASHPQATPSCVCRPIDIYRQARLIAGYARSLRGPAVFVAVMEEAASAVRLALGPSSQAIKPYIVQTHAWESYYLPIMYGCPGFDLEWEHAAFANALRDAAAVTSPCQGCRDDLVAAFQSPPETTVAIPNPVDVAAIRRASLVRPEKPLPSPCAASPMFLSVGRLDPQKNHALLFEACALLRDRGMAFTLVCLGDGFHSSELEDRIRELNLESRVFLLGCVKNPFPYMRKAVAHITTSDSESFGMVIAETMACGSLAISLDCPHGPREILDHGRAGLLVSSPTPEALAAAMKQALTDRMLVQEKLRRANRAIERFTTSAVVSRWEILLAHVAAQHGNIY